MHKLDKQKNSLLSKLRLLPPLNNLFKILTVLSLQSGSLVSYSFVQRNGFFIVISSGNANSKPYYKALEARGKEIEKCRLCLQDLQHFPLYLLYTFGSEI